MVSKRGLAGVILASSVLLGAVLLCHSVVGPVSAPTRMIPGSPLVCLKEPIFDGGEVPFGTVVRHIFPIQNRSENTVRIDAVAASCGCTEAKVEPEEIPAGGMAEVSVELKVEAQWGSEGQVVLSSSSMGHRPLLQLLIRARVKDSLRLTAQPMEVQIESDILGKSSGGQALVSYLFQDEPLKGISFEAPEWLLVDVREEGVFPRPNRILEQRFLLHMIPISGLNPGRCDGRILVRSGKAGVADLSLSIHLNVPGDFRPPADTLFLGIVPHQTITRTFRFRREAGSAASVASIVCTEPKLSLDWKEDVEGFVISITMDSKDFPADHAVMGEIMIAVNGGRTKEIRIPIKGKIAS